MCAFYQTWHMSQKVFVIPYLNVGVSNHPLNPEKKVKYVDLSYVVCDDPVIVKLNSKTIFENTSLKFGSYSFWYLGGVDTGNRSSNEFQVLSKTISFYVPHEARLSETGWGTMASGELVSSVSQQLLSDHLSLRKIDAELADRYGNLIRNVGLSKYR